MPVAPEIAQAITQKKARYGRYVDTKDWHRFEKEVCLPDIKCEFLDTDGSLIKVGRLEFAFGDAKSFAAFFDGFFRGKQTLHMFGPGDFEPTASPDEVRAVFSLEDEILVEPLGPWAEIRGGGFYYETWRRVGGEWYLKDLKMTRTYQKMTALVSLGLFLQNVLGLPIF